MSKPEHDHRGESVAALDRSTRRDLEDLFRLATDANAALISGEINSYLDMVAPAEDFTLMDPMGGAPRHGYDPTPDFLEGLRRFFRGGTSEVELVQATASGCLAVLAVIERMRAGIADLPEQAWSLRVTLVFRRDGPRWRLLHRHADPLAGRISLEEAAALGRR
jgi:ketosteroid isomerase-like protein